MALSAKKVPDPCSRAFKWEAGQLSAPPIREQLHTGVYWTLPLTQNKAFLTLQVEGHPILGFIDSGADVSVIRKEDKKEGWAMQPGTLVQGVSGVPLAQQAIQPLHWTDPEGVTGVFSPLFMTELPHTLWGRDVLSLLCVSITSQPPNSKGHCSMKNSRTQKTYMGYRPTNLG
ncbi:endogenous retrovirus group K member 113 Pro protein-like [Saccopteryx leptura]|uniref:endogenous retrovirus group K member 113 Pro protein-like n=1 Tax=Saccopteryx leptura TaxID=249018 RepID=UPI00339CA67F